MGGRISAHGEGASQHEALANVKLPGLISSKSTIRAAQGGGGPLMRVTTCFSSMDSMKSEMQSVPDPPSAKPLEGWL